MGEQTDITYERIVYVASATLSDQPDIVMDRNVGLEFQDVTFVAEGCVEAFWTLERLDLPTHSR